MDNPCSCLLRQGSGRVLARFWSNLGILNISFASIETIYLPHESLQVLHSNLSAKSKNAHYAEWPISVYLFLYNWIILIDMQSST